MLVLALGACRASDEGIVVSVGTLHHQHDDPRLQELGVRYRTNEVRYMFTQIDHDVLLHKAYLGVRSLQLRPCTDGELAAPAHGGVMSWLRDLWLPRARAHMSTTPNSLGVPFVLDLMQEEGRRTQFATMPGLPGRYCRVLLDLAPLDDDALGLPEDDDIVGMTLRLEGVYIDADSHVETPFTITSRQQRQVMSAIEPKSQSEPHMTLSPERPRTELTMHFGYAHLLDQVDVSDVQPGDGAQILENLLTRLRTTSCSGEMCE